MFKRVQQFSLAESMTRTSVALEILEQDERLVALWHQIDVLDNELVIVYKNDQYSQVLTTGRYVFWKGLIDYRFTRVDVSKIYITEAIDKAIFAKYDLAKYVRSFEVAASEKAVLLVDDVYVKTLRGGTYRFWRNATTIKMAKVDTRQLQLEVAGQELLTKDKAAIRINFYTQYKVTDVKKAILDNKDFEKQLRIIPDESILYHALKNHFSLWLMARGEIQLAKIINPIKASDFNAPKELREYILDVIQNYRSHVT